MTTAFPSPAHETIGTEPLQRFGWGDAALWGMAFVVILSVEAAGLFTLSNWRNQPEIPGAPPPAIMIELSEISVAPQVEDIAADDGELSLAQDAATPIEPTPAQEVPEETAEPVEDVPEDVLEPVETAEPIAEPIPDLVEPEPLDVAEAVLPEPLQTPPPEPLELAEPAPVDTVEAIEPVEAEPDELVPELVEPLPEPEPIEELIPDVVEIEVAEVYVPMPRPVPAALEARRREFAEVQQRQQDERKRQAEERERKEAAEKKRRQEQAAASSAAPKSVEAQNADRPAAASESTTTRRTPSISPQRWQSQVIAHLNRMKRYPADARRRREEGVPQLQFSIDRSGRVLSARIVRSSGFPSLDQAALDMINRASPLPAPPASMPDSRITLTVPVNFNLR